MSMPTQGLASIAPAIQSHFHLDLVRTGLVPVAVNLGVTLTMLLWGVATDRFDERWALAAGMTASAACLALAATTHTYLPLVGLLVLAGAFGSVVNTGSGRAIMAWFDGRERGLALGFRQMAAPLGGGLASLVLPVVTVTRGVPASILCVAACVGAAGIAAAVFIRLPAGAQRRVPEVAGGPSALRDRRLWRITAAAGLLAATQSAFVTYLTLFLTSRAGFSITTAALVLAAVQLTGGAGRTLVGHISDRRRLRVPLMRGLMLAGAVALAITAVGWQSVPLLLVPLLMAGGWLLTAAFALTYTVASDIVSVRHVGKAFGFVGTLTSAGAFAGPAVFGLAVAAAGWTAGFALLGAAAVAIAVILTPLVGDERRRLATASA